MKLALIRLSLFAREQRDAFELQTIGREATLRGAFGRSFDFSHRRKLFWYEPFVSDLLPPDCIAGFVGRPKRVRDNRPPEEGLLPTEHEIWKAALLVIDPRDHPDGQKVAFQVTQDVGVPLSVFRSMTAKLNAFGLDDGPLPFAIEPGGISDDRDFWTFVAQHEGEIVSATFDFYAPNMFGIHDDYDAELRDLRDEEKAEKVSVTLSSGDGLNLNTPRVAHAASQIRRGTGQVTARLRDGETFSSDAAGLHVNVPEEVGGAPLRTADIAARVLKAWKALIGDRDE